MSGSRASIPDNELAQEWPFLTRQQVHHHVDTYTFHCSPCKLRVTSSASGANVCLHFVSACALQCKRYIATGYTSLVYAVGGIQGRFSNI